MAIDPSKLVGVGTSANDNTGDPLRTAFIQINDNFTELYVEPSISLVGNTLTLTRPDDSTSTVDLAPYLDEDARAISSGTIDGASIVTFTRDDATTFTLDLSSLLDNTNLVTSVAGKTGVVTLVKGDVGLGNVDNTSDANKPISTATQTALDLKANLASPTFTGTVGGVSKGMVGLGNVDNTSDANKPVSTAGQTALNLKYDASNPAGYTSNVGDITSIVAGNGLTGDTTSGDATLDVVGGDGITANADEIEVTVDDSTIELSASDGTGAVRIKDNGVDHAQLSNSYTELSPLGTGTAFAINFDSATTFTATANGAATLTMSNAQQGQVVDVILDGDFAITLAETGSTFNKVGTTVYDGTTNNIIQIICTDDTSGSKIYHYAVSTYTAGATV
jgi:hypothetical protein